MCGTTARWFACKSVWRLIRFFSSLGAVKKKTECILHQRFTQYTEVLAVCDDQEGRIKNRLKSVEGWLSYPERDGTKRQMGVWCGIVAEGWAKGVSIGVGVFYSIALLYDRVQGVLALVHLTLIGTIQIIFAIWICNLHNFTSTQYSCIRQIMYCGARTQKAAADALPWDYARLLGSI